MSKWLFSVIDNWDDVWHPEHIERWSGLLSHSPSAHVFFHPSLVKAWVDTYMPLRVMAPIFLWCRDQSGNEVFLPLVLWRKNWKNAFQRSIVPVGYSDYDYHDPISSCPIDDIQEFWCELINFLVSNYDYDEIRFDGITGDFAMSGNMWNEGDTCPYLSLAGLTDEEQLLSTLKTSLRGDIRRQIRRLKENGELLFNVYSSPDETMATFESFLKEHTHRWPNAYKAPSFHRNLIECGLKSGLVNFSSIDIDGNPIAWHLGFTYKGRFYYYMPAGRQSYAKYSPVKVHLYYLVKWSIEHGFTVFDHLRGDENYKNGWSSGCQYVNTLLLQNTGLLPAVKRQLLKLKR